MGIFKHIMKRSDINPMPQYWDRYINLVPDVELAQAFDGSIRQLEQVDRTALARVGDKTYSPGKWTVKDIIQHVSDAERVLCYRSLVFARRDGTTPSGFEQDIFAQNALPNRRSMDDLLDELIMVRRSTKAMYDSFTDDMLIARGISWEFETAVLDMGFTIIGHQIHHLNVIAERYSQL